jgi:4-hydroxy-tetrahydrodipicolinate synthase
MAKSQKRIANSSFFKVILLNYNRKDKEKLMKFDSSKIHGIVVPVITPLKSDESIDVIALYKIIDYLLSAKVHGIFVNSTTGEGICLTDLERQQALKIVVEKAKSHIPVYAGISDTSTKLTLQNLKEAEDLGADIAVVHPPFFYPPNSQEEIYIHFEQIVQSASIPIMLYNIPSITKAPIALETMQRLLNFERIIGVKDSSCDFILLQSLIKLKYLRPDFKVFVGKCQLWTAGILSGANGGLDGISNLIPRQCVRLYQKIRSGSSPQAFALQREINEIWRVYECRSFLGGLKAAMHLLGFCEPITTKPILPASEEEIQKIKQILSEKGILAIT